MTKELIAGVVGAIVSVALEIVPGLSDKWSDWEWKPMTMFVLSLGVPVAITILSCEVQVQIPGMETLQCTPEGYTEALLLGFSAFLGNQGTFLGVAHRLPNARRRQ